MKNLFPVMSLSATAALAFVTLVAPNAQAQSGSQAPASQAQASASQAAYQGVSQPPADDVIEATPDQAPAPVHTKPSAQVLANQQYAPPASQPADSRPASSTPVSATNTADPDYSIVTSVPAAGSTSATSEHADYPAPSANARLISRPENPDYDIVGVVPSPSSQLAEGTDIRVRLMQNLSTRTTQDGSYFRGQVAADVYKEGRVVIPVGSELRGRVVSVTQGHRMGAPATLRLRPDAVLLPDGSSYHLYAQAIHTSAPNTRTDAEGGLQPSSRLTKDLVEYGAGAGGGAATGAIFGGPVGAAAGAIVGAGIVTTHLLLQHPHQASIEQGSEVTFSLTEPMDLVPARN